MKQRRKIILHRNLPIFSAEYWFYKTAFDLLLSDEYVERPMGQSDRAKGVRATGSDKHALSVLGLEPDATPVEIRKTYRRLAAVHHPDRGGSEFVRIHKVYEWLQQTMAKID